MLSHTPSLGHIGNTYVSHAKLFYETNPNDLTPLLDYLPDLTLDSKYVLEDFRPREQTNSVLWLYVREKNTEPLQDENCINKENNLFFTFGQNSNKRYTIKSIKIAGISILTYRKKIKPINPFSYIHLPFTKEAAWQAYLLQRTYHIIGMRWHGGYAKRLFINLPGDIDKIKEIHPLASSETNSTLEKLIEACKEAYSLPTVNLTGNKAIVVHCWFDAWQGLIRVTWQGKYNKWKKRIGRFKITKEEVLVKYNCRIKY